MKAKPLIEMELRTGDRDETLLRAIAQGDEGAFSELYGRHLPVIVGWLYRQTGDREVAADLSAEVFAAALIHARRYRAERGSAGAWLLGIARNKLRESARRRRVEDRARKRLGIEPVVLTDADLERVEEMACATGAGTALLDGLPEDQRAALVGRVLDERTYAELSERLRCSEMVVRQRVSRGLKTLRSQMEGQ
jgi:RNA polymerase sigma factor (sigma-70 family)